MVFFLVFSAHRTVYNQWSGHRFYTFFVPFSKSFYVFYGIFYTSILRFFCALQLRSVVRYTFLSRTGI